MRFLLIFTLALGFQMFGAGEAEARRGVSGYAEALELVETTTIPGQNGSPLSLCVLVRTQHVLFVDVWRTQKGYALAENRCDVESFIPIDGPQLASLKADGLVSADLAEVPDVKTGIAVPIWAWIVILGVVGFIAYKAKAKAGRKAQRQSLMGNTTPAVMAIIDAMCHVSKADGDVSAQEVKEISIAAEQMTGEAVDPTRVAEMAQLAEANLTDGDYKKFAAGRSEDEKEVMMRGVLYVAIADGKLDGKEREFVGKLASVMKMPSDRVTVLLNEVIASRVPTPA